MWMLQVGLLLAFKRMVLLTLTSILALSRLDACLFTMMRDSDQGYKSFLALALMLYSFQARSRPHFSYPLSPAYGVLPDGINYRLRGWCRGHRNAVSGCTRQWLGVQTPLTVPLCILKNCQLHHCARLNESLSLQKCLKEHTISKKDGKNKVERTRWLTTAKAAQLWRAKVAAARLRRAATPSTTGSHSRIAPPEQHVSTGGTPHRKAPMSRGS